jgi:hypothetical protein
VAVYLNETIDKNKSGVIMGITNSMFPLVGLINLGVMFYLKNWLFMYIFIIILNIATNILGMLYMEESTAWLNANKKVRQLLVSFENISKLNNTYDDYKNYLESTLSTQYFSLAKKKKTDAGRKV